MNSHTTRWNNHRVERNLSTCEHCNSLRYLFFLFPTSFISWLKSNLYLSFCSNKRDFFRPSFQTTYFETSSVPIPLCQSSQSENTVRTKTSLEKFRKRWKLEQSLVFREWHPIYLRTDPLGLCLFDPGLNFRSPRVRVRSKAIQSSKGSTVTEWDTDWSVFVPYRWS